jgi:degradative hydroxymethylglutaryl-CoA reductase
MSNLPSHLLPSPWSGFHRKTLLERRGTLAERFPHVDAPRLDGSDLPQEVADVMIENCVGSLAVPLGLGLHMQVNGQDYAVPMAVEEPSIIAAVSVASKLVRSHGGFDAASTANLMIAQVQLLDIAETDVARATLEANREELISGANAFCPRMVARGGGCRDIQVRVLEPLVGVDESPMLVVHLVIDVCEAMGANVVNTVAEGLAPRLAELVSGRAGLRILSNLSVERRSRAAFRLPVEALAWKGFDGTQVAQRLLEAYRFAERDPYRATTHNKGIMNGIDAVALATGQDWRAIEAGAHAWAAREGRYRSLTRYWLEGSNFCGELELPMALGTKGGALQSHPTYRYTHALLGDPGVGELAQIMVAVGLAQNFAAMRALATEGISAGHMALHARNLAMAAGVPSERVAEAVAYMRARGKINREGAREYLASAERRGQA